MEPIPVITEESASGRPRRIRPRSLAGVVVGEFVLAAAAGGLAFLVDGVSHTCGATRSARVEWQQRQAQIERTLASEPDPPAPPE
jgi:hypothetical protein